MLSINNVRHKLATFTRRRRFSTTSSDPSFLTAEWMRRQNPVMRRSLIECSIEESESNPLYFGVISTLANDCVGTCPKPVALLDDDVLADAIEDQWLDTAVSNGYGATLRELRLKAAQTGIAVAIPIKKHRTHDHPIRLGFVVVGAEFIRSPSTAILNEDLIRDGVEYFRNGDIKAVYIQEDDKAEPTRFLEKDCIIFTRKRVHALWPECATAFDVYPSIKRYFINIMRQVEQQSAIPMFIKLGDKYPVQDPSNIPFGKVEYKPGMLPTLPPGTDVQAFPGNALAEDRQAFANLLGSTAARCINMPRIRAMLYSGDQNMATAHVDMQPWATEVRIDRFDFERCVRKMTRMWYNFAQVSVLPPSAMLHDRPPLLFNYTTLFQHPDPQKRATATETNLRSGASTLTRVYAEEGLVLRREIDKECKNIGCTREQYFSLILAARSKEVAQHATEETSDEEPDKELNRK